MARSRARGGGEPEKENHERWLITYADLITLLMVFFVVLYSMARSDSSKFQRVSASLERAFNVDVLKGSSASSIGGDGAGTQTVIVEQMFQSPDEGVNQEAQRLKRKLETIVPGQLKQPDLAVGTSRDGIVVRLSGSFLFDSGRAEVKPNAYPILDTLAEQLRAVANDVRVDGHTDSTPIDSPRFPTNWELSTARATAITRYLSEVGGVPASRLSAAGFGEFRPVATNETRAGRALNRRVEVNILAPTTPNTSFLEAPGTRTPSSTGSSGAAPETATSPDAGTNGTEANPLSARLSSVDSASASTRVNP